MQVVAGTSVHIGMQTQWPLCLNSNTANIFRI